MASRKAYANNVAEVDPNSFGGQLRACREAAGLSQAELGDLIGKDQKRISTYELGHVIPREDIIVALADALRVPAARFFEATRFRGAIPIGSERRERLARAKEDDWLLFDRVLDELGNVTPEQRRQFERGFETFLRTWNES